MNTSCFLCRLLAPLVRPATPMEHHCRHTTIAQQEMRTEGLVVRYEEFYFHFVWGCGGGGYFQPHLEYRKCNPSCDYILSFPINSLDTVMRNNNNWFCFLLLFHLFALQPPVIMNSAKCSVQDEGPVEWGHLRESHQTVDDHCLSHPPYCLYHHTVAVSVHR